MWPAARTRFSTWLRYSTEWAFCQFRTFRIYPPMEFQNSPSLSEVKSNRDLVSAKDKVRCGEVKKGESLGFDFQIAGLGLQSPSAPGANGMTKGVRPRSRAEKSPPDLCTGNQDSLTLGSSAVHSVPGVLGSPTREGSSRTCLGCPVGPVHPLVGGRLTQGVYHLSDSWTAKGSWKPPILPLPENAGLWLSRNSLPCQEMPPADLPFLSVVSRRISFSAPQGLQKRGQIKNLNSFPAPLLGPSRY